MNSFNHNPESGGQTPTPSLGNQNLTGRLTPEEIQAFFALAQESAWETIKNWYMSTQEAGDYLKLSARWLEELRVIGGGPKYLKPGRRVVYRRDDLDAWLGSFECRNTAERGGR